MFKCTQAFLLALLLLASSSTSREVLAIENSAAAFIHHTISKCKVAIFAKSYCPYSKKAKALLTPFRVEGCFVDLDLREDGSEVQDSLPAMTGRRTVPQVFIDGAFFGDSSQTIAACKDDAHTLRAALLQAGVSLPSDFCVGAQQVAVSSETVTV